MPKFEGSKSPFLTPEELMSSKKQHEDFVNEDTMAQAMNAPNPMPRGYITDWKRTAQYWEKNKNEGYEYPAIRREGESIGRRTLESYHNNESFIDWIRQKLAQSDSLKRINVLDVGGGAGIYAEQLRNEFKEKINVYTTGLKKQAAVRLRTALNNNKSEYFKKPSDMVLNTKPHDQDLKWRSILQLSDYEEFDLIVDTAGEFAYAAKDIRSIKRYIEAVIHKLLPGGKASIGFISQEQYHILNDILREVEKNDEYGGNITFDLQESTFKSREPEYVLKIVKHVN